MILSIIAHITYSIKWAYAQDLRANLFQIKLCYVYLPPQLLLKWLTCYQGNRRRLCYTHLKKMNYE